MNMKTIPIFFTFDNNYTIPAIVALWSLLNKTPSSIHYNLHILHDDISKENQNLLNDKLSQHHNYTLFFHNTENFSKNAFENGTFTKTSNSSVFTSATILRCFASKFFPQYEKIIYSDVDVVFMDDISELIDIKLDNKYIAAVKNPFLKHYDFELSHLKKEHFDKLKDSYFAGGIWVLNLKKIREDNLEQKMWDIVNDQTIIKKWNDQDIMNIACMGKVSYLPLNYISYPYLDDVMKEKNFSSHYSHTELFDSIINPKILHFASYKPWNTKTHLFEIWWNIFDYLNLQKKATYSKATMTDDCKKTIDYITNENLTLKKKCTKLKHRIKLLKNVAYFFILFVIFLIFYL